ncbi:hypothetical protein [Sphingomonas crocodyli]|uniref:hypothetical protein n=1 Tax=Sphingomonas crocodyli TaxID=1979270 RepID=UPI0013E2FE67|nr:hypothetical protein [Sphingomonas crocodyli]
MPRHDPVQSQPIELSTQEARAGATPRMTRYVLGVGILLVVVAFGILLVTMMART